MKLTKVIKGIIAQPLNRHRKIRAVCSFIWWQLRCRITSKPYIYRFTDHSLLLLRKHHSAAVVNLYYGLHEFSEMGFLLHFLRNTDSFVDVGSNIGAFTVLAAKHAGASAVAIEPADLAFKGLLNNLTINGIEKKVHACRVAAGWEKGEVYFTDHLNTMNHVSVNAKGNLVRSDTLDNILSTLQNPALIKIDVEGYELAVLKGAVRTLGKSELKAIIIEVNNQGRRYNVAKKDVFTMLQEHGFDPFQYDPFKRELTPLTTFAGRNTIFLRDVDLVKERLRTARYVQLLGKCF